MQDGIYQVKIETLGKAKKALKNTDETGEIEIIENYGMEDERTVHAVKVSH